MASLVCVHDRRALERWFRRDPALYLYELGDLDDFFFAYTTWYALGDVTVPLAVALVYTAAELPVVIALARETDQVRIAALFQRRFYVHTSAVGLDVLKASGWRVTSRGLHNRMVLAHPEALEEVQSREAITLQLGDALEVEPFYPAAYPEKSRRSATSPHTAGVSWAWPWPNALPATRLRPHCLVRKGDRRRRGDLSERACPGCAVQHRTTHPGPLAARASGGSLVRPRFGQWRTL